MADAAQNTISVVSEIDGKRCKLVIKNGLRSLTVANIKKHLAGPTGVPVQDQVLSYNGVVLQDYQTGEQIDLRAGAQLRLSSITQGPPQPPLPPPPAATEALPPPPSGLPTQQGLGYSTQQAPYYSPSESSLGAQTNQVSTVSKETSVPSAVPQGVPLTAPVHAADPATLQPDIRGRERQKEEELRTLQRRTEELEYDRAVHAQAGLRQTGPGQMVALPSPHAAQLLPASQERTPHAVPLMSQGLPPPPNPARIDPAAAGYNDLQSTQERHAIERQAAMQDHIERERNRFDDLHANMTDRIDRQERMIKGSRRERELEEQVYQLEQQCGKLKKDCEAANARASQDDTAARQRVMELEAKLQAAEDVANARATEIATLQARQRDLENRLLDATAQAAKAQEQQLAAAVSASGAPAVGNSLTGLALARQNLAEFGRDIGVGEQIDFDENLTCVVGLEQRYTILLTYDGTTERLYVYATLLSYLPKDPPARLRLYEVLLEGALLGREMCGGGVGLSMKNELLLMSTSIDLKHSDSAALRDVAPTFVDCLVKWRQLVKETLLDAEHQQQPTQPHQPQQTQQIHTSAPVTPTSYAARAGMSSFPSKPIAPANTGGYHRTGSGLDLASTAEYDPMAAQRDLTGRYNMIQ